MINKESKNTFLSIITPVYNVAEYLSTCIQSILVQTYSNIELILVDDGSTDGSGEICDEWASRDKRIRVIHQKNRGVSSARNMGLMKSKGTIIGFVDSDDWIEPEMYEKMINALGDADMIACGYVDYVRGLDKPILKGMQSVGNCSFEKAIIQMYRKDGFFTSIWNKLYKREILYDVKFDESIKVGEDELWLISVMKNGCNFGFLPEPLYHYRLRTDSVSRIVTEHDKQLTVLNAKKQVISHLKENKNAQSAAKAIMYHDCFLMAVQWYCVGDWRRAREMMRAIAPMKRDSFCLWVRLASVLRTLIKKLKEKNIYSKYHKKM